MPIFCVFYAMIIPEGLQEIVKATVRDFLDL